MAACGWVGLISEVQARSSTFHPCNWSHIKPVMACSDCWPRTVLSRILRNCRTVLISWFLGEAFEMQQVFMMSSVVQTCGEKQPFLYWACSSPIKLPRLFPLCLISYCFKAFFFCAVVLMPRGLT